VWRGLANRGCLLRLMPITCRIAPCSLSGKMPSRQCGKVRYARLSDSPTLPWREVNGFVSWSATRDIRTFSFASAGTSGRGSPSSAEICAPPSSREWSAPLDIMRDVQRGTFWLQDFRRPGTRIIERQDYDGVSICLVIYRRSAANCQMASLGRLELPTHCLEGMARYAS